MTLSSRARGELKGKVEFVVFAKRRPLAIGSLVAISQISSISAFSLSACSDDASALEETEFGERDSRDSGVETSTEANALP